MSRALGAIENDDRDLALGQRLLLLDVGNARLELVALLGTGGAGAHLELVWTNFDRRDRARLQVVVPGRVRGGAVAGGDDHVAIAILPKTEHGCALLPRLCAGRRQQHDVTASQWAAAELSTIGTEFLDHLLVERVHVGWDLHRRLSVGRQLLAHVFIYTSRL